MTCNTTINCVKCLLRQGVKLSDIRISTPRIALGKLRSSNSKIGKDAACQTNIPQTTTEDLFTEVCDELNMSTIDFDIILSEIIRDLSNWFTSILSTTTHRLLTPNSWECYSIKCVQCNGQTIKRDWKGRTLVRTIQSSFPIEHNVDILLKPRSNFHVCLRWSAINFFSVDIQYSMNFTIHSLCHVTLNFPKQTRVL